MTDDQLELASAYLDGEATAAERALVEADADLLAEVERMRSVRNAVSDIDPPSVDGRESAIAAALAAFDDLPSATSVPATREASLDPTAPTNIIPFERRNRMRRLQGMTAAAAALILVVGGFAISRRDSGNDTNSAADGQANTLFEAPAVTGRDTELTAATSVEPMLVGAPTTLGHVAADQAADAALSTDDTDSAEIAESGAAATTASGAAPTMPAAPAPAAATASDDTLVRLVVMLDVDDLIDFASTMKDEPIALDDAETRCDDGTLKAEAIFEDEDGRSHPIVVVTVDDNIAALALDDCEIVVSVE